MYKKSKIWRGDFSILKLFEGQLKDWTVWTRQMSSLSQTGISHFLRCIFAQLFAMLDWSYLENVVPGQRLRCVPTESDKRCRHGDRKQNYVQHLQQSDLRPDPGTVIAITTYFDLQLNRSAEVSHLITSSACVVSPVLRVDIGQCQSSGWVNTSSPVLTMTTGPGGHWHRRSEPGARELPLNYSVHIGTIHRSQWPEMIESQLNEAIIANSNQFHFYNFSSYGPLNLIK